MSSSVKKPLRIVVVSAADDKIETVNLPANEKRPNSVSFSKQTVLAVGAENGLVANKIKVSLQTGGLPYPAGVYEFAADSFVVGQFESLTFAFGPSAVSLVRCGPDDKFAKDLEARYLK